MSSVSVAYLGPEGTFSHLVAMKHFGPKTRLLPMPTFGAVFDFVAENENARGVVPKENSSGGAITEAVDLLIKHRSRIFVTAELALDVRLALLGHQGEPVKQVFSHAVPLHHQGEWLKKEFPRARLVAVSSTAVAAQRAAKARGAVALAAPGSAKLYGLDVLRFPVRPEAVNVTHFFALSRAPLPPSHAPGQKTAFYAALKNQCGSLHGFLGPFAKAGVNLRSIVSRPVPGHPQTYVFFIEIDGAETDATVAKALRGAARFADSIQSFGSFPSGKRLRS